ncbi:MAG: hypothetical protein OCC49_00430 [Fibrobacterales bacterium]
MTRFALFASAIAVFCTINCSEDPVDNNPPVVNDLSKTIYSVYDTITINFNEELLAFSEANYSATPTLNCMLDSTSMSNVKCVAPTTGTAGIPQLESNTTYSIALKSIADGHNNTAIDTTISLQTMYWTDLDFSDGSTPANDNVGSAVYLNELSDALPSETLLNGKLITEGIFLSGALGKAQLNYDTQDYYSLSLKARDSLSIDVSDITNTILIRVYGSKTLESTPDAEAIIEKEFTPGTADNLTYYVSAEDFFTMEYITFWVRVSIIDPRQDAFSPYTLNISKKSR